MQCQPYISMHMHMDLVFAICATHFTSLNQCCCFSALSSPTPTHTSNQTRVVAILLLFSSCPPKPCHSAFSIAPRKSLQLPFLSILFGSQRKQKKLLEKSLNLLLHAQTMFSMRLRSHIDWASSHLKIKCISSSVPSLHIRQ